MNRFKLIAILGGSGSGKSALGLKLAEQLKCDIFSLDSLAIYQGFDIVSAKPTQNELLQICHYGIDVLKPDEKNNAVLFKNLLLKSINQSQKKGKNTLLIIGGSSFYLKSIIEGLSPIPTLTSQQSLEITDKIQSLPNAYEFLKQIDPSSSICQYDTYRITKALEIYFATLTPPSLYFATHPKERFPYFIEKYAIAIDREKLREKIIQRTQNMIQNGLIEEIEKIFNQYNYTIQPANAIGVKETIEYITQTPLEILQGKTASNHPMIAKDIHELSFLISTHTAQLAKRQTTFNRTQFGKIYPPSSTHTAQDGIVWGSVEDIFETILKNNLQR